MSDQASKSFVRDISHSAIVPASRVVRSAEVAHIGGRPASHKGTAAVELLKEDEVVKAIDVICECGQKIRIWCSYENDSESQKQN